MFLGCQEDLSGVLGRVWEPRVRGHTKPCLSVRDTKVYRKPENSLGVTGEKFTHTSHNKKFPGNFKRNNGREGHPVSR